MTVSFNPQGVCSRKMLVSAEDGVITDAQIIGGCGGNTKGVCSLIKGMAVGEAIGRLSGIDCGGRGTSCPDQLSLALRELLETEK